MSKIKINTADLYQDSVTGNIYQLNPDGTFTQTTTAGAAHVAPVSDPNGNYPPNNFTPFSVTTTAAAVLSLTGLQGMHSGRFILTLAGGETMAVACLNDNGQAAGAPLLQQVDNATPGTKVNPSALASGMYEFVAPLVCSGLTFTKSAAVQSCTLIGQLSGAS